MPDAATIRLSIKARLEELRPLVEEIAALERAEAILAEFAPPEPEPDDLSDERYQQDLVENDRFHAPHGFKADGTPYKRKPPTQEEIERRKATRAANLKARQAPPRPKSEEIRLNVISSTHPTERELEDRRVAHVTAEPK